jgi:hypothetical protein
VRGGVAGAVVGFPLSKQQLPWTICHGHPHRASLLCHHPHTRHAAPQNPTQDAVIDPIRGVTKRESDTPGHKIQMRPSDQVGSVCCVSVCVCLAAGAGQCDACNQAQGMHACMVVHVMTRLLLTWWCG